MKLLKIIFSAFILSSLALSCSNKKFEVPTNILQPNEFVALMIEMHLVDGYLHQSLNTLHSRKDSAFLIYPAILQKYGISRTQLDSTVLFYGKYPKEFNKIYDQVLDSLSVMEGETRELIEKDSIQIDEM